MPFALPNPVIVPVYADPVVWGIALACLYAEVAVVCRLLARVGVRGAWVRDRLVVIQLVSWLGFLLALDRLVPAGGNAMVLVGLEAAVVVVEAVAMRVAFCRSPVRAAFTAWPRLFAWSLLGNVVSAASCAAILGCLRWFA